MSVEDAFSEWREILDEITSALEELSESLRVEDDFRVLLQQVCDLVPRAIADVDHATITILRGEDEAETVASTHDDLVDLDATQYEARRGPCLEAAESQQLVRIKIKDVGERWPEFAEKARQAGVGSFLSAPLLVDGEYSGTVNCYGCGPHGFDELDAQLLELYTTAVEAALRSHRRYEKARMLAEQLGSALRTRPVIDQAKGILMAVRRITAKDAFELLVQQSQRENTKVRDIAERFVSEVTGQAG